MRATIGIGMSISMLAGCAVEDLKSPCTDCVSAEVVLRLGELDGRMALTESRGVTFDSVGSLWISQGHYLVVADSLGDFVREVGASGQGPMEFNTALTILPVRDGVAVFDSGNLRASIVSPKGDFVRAFPLAGPVFDGVQLAAAGLILATGSPTAEGLIRTVQRVDEVSGEVIASFGVPVPFPSGPLPRVSLALSGEDVLVAHRSTFVVERIDTKTGATRQRESLERSFLVSGGGSRALASGQPPNSALQSIQFDRQDRVWLVYWVPAVDWSEQFFEDERGLILVPGGNSALFDSMVEVLDSTMTRVLARQRLPVAINKLWPDGRAFGWVVDEDGVPQLEIYRMGFAPNG